MIQKKIPYRRYRRKSRQICVFGQTSQPKERTIAQILPEKQQMGGWTAYDKIKYKRPETRLVKKMQKNCVRPIRKMSVMALETRERSDEKQNGENRNKNIRLRDKIKF